LNNSKIASSLFKKKVGEISEGAYADLVIMDVKPFDNKLNLMNLDTSLVNSVIVDGRWKIKNKKFVFDLEESEKEIERAAKRIRKKRLQF
jgi:cytosine/adenosine deaminase-related metal-dependent hydrolase